MFNKTTEPSPSKDHAVDESSSPELSERIQTIGTVLVESEASLKAAIRLYFSHREMPTTEDEIDDLYGALADRALRSASQCAPGIVPIAWLKRMALNLVRERRRHLHKLKPVSQIFEARRVDERDEAHSQVELLEALRRKAQSGSEVPLTDIQSESLPSLQELLSLVSPPYHNILRWSITDGLDALSIASYTGQSVGSVHTQLCRARQHLRTAWKHWQEEI